MALMPHFGQLANTTHNLEPTYLCGPLDIFTTNFLLFLLLTQYSYSSYLAFGEAAHPLGRFQVIIYHPRGGSYVHDEIAIGPGRQGSALCRPYHPVGSGYMLISCPDRFIFWVCVINQYMCI